MRIFPLNQPILELWINQAREYRIGRAADCDLRLDESGISRHHLLIDARQEPWLILDPGSKNGSRIDGRPLDRAELRQACWLSLAGVPARLERLDERALRDRDLRRTQLEHTASLLLERIRAPGDIGQRLDQLLEAFLELAGCARGALVLITDSGQVQDCHLCGWTSFPGLNEHMIATLKNGKPITRHDLATAPEAERHAAAPGGAVVCVPLQLDDRVHGFLYGESEQPGKCYTALDVDLMEALAEQAMLLIDAASIARQLDRLAKES